MSQALNFVDVLQTQTKKVASGGLHNLFESIRKRSQPKRDSSMSNCSCYYEKSDYELLGKGCLGVGTKRQKIDIAWAYTTDQAKVNEAWREAEEVDLDDMLS